MKIDYLALAQIKRKIAVAGLSARRGTGPAANVYAFTPQSNAVEPITPVFTSARGKTESVRLAA